MSPDRRARKCYAPRGTTTGRIRTPLVFRSLGHAYQPQHAAMHPCDRRQCHTEDDQHDPNEFTKAHGGPRHLTFTPSHCPGRTGILSVFCEAMTSQFPSLFCTTQVNIPERAVPCFTCRTLSPVVDQRTRAIARSG